jgi:hypothetical protein
VTELDKDNGRKNPSGPPHELGQIISGSLTEGLVMKLDPGESVEDIRAGKFVVIDGKPASLLLHDHRRYPQHVVTRPAG